MSDEPAPKIEMSDAIKLAIRDEVEKRLDNPSAKHIGFIETEVEKRVAFRVNQYKLLIAVITVLLGGFGTLFGTILYNKTLATAREEATKQIAGAEAVKAGQRVIALAGDVEKQSQRVNGLTDDVIKNHDEFMTRLEQIRKQDKVVLLDEDGFLRLRNPVFLNAPLFFESDNAYIQFNKGGRISSVPDTNGVTSINFLPDGRVIVDCPGVNLLLCSP